MDKKERAGMPYCPSNGSEGMWFTDVYCMMCRNCDPNPDGEKQCEILGNSFAYMPGDPEYPKEWVYNKEGNPRCTAFVRWDWEEMGNPDDPENPNYVQPPDPNQLTLL